MKEICAGIGVLTKIDDIDYPYLIPYSWYLNGSGKGYVTTKMNHKHISMHSMIIGFMGLTIPLGMEVDHKDRDCWNNQRFNLRIVTKSVNNRNRGVPSSNQLGVKGVIFCNTFNKYRATIHDGKKKIHLGYFLSFEEALAARLRAERILQIT